MEHLNVVTMCFPFGAKNFYILENKLQNKINCIQPANAQTNEKCFTIFTSFQLQYLVQLFMDTVRKWPNIYIFSVRLLLSTRCLCVCGGVWPGYDDLMKINSNAFDTKSISYKCKCIASALWHVVPFKRTPHLLSETFKFPYFHSLSFLFLMNYFTAQSEWINTQTHPTRR